MVGGASNYPLTHSRILSSRRSCDPIFPLFQAKDKDSGEFGKIEYHKNSWTKAAEAYFALDADTGIISNIKTFENVPKEFLPFKFSVTARDNPHSTQDYNIARASVVVSIFCAPH